MDGVTHLLTNRAMVSAFAAARATPNGFAHIPMVSQRPVQHAKQTRACPGVVKISKTLLNTQPITKCQRREEWEAKRLTAALAKNKKFPR